MQQDLEGNVQLVDHEDLYLIQDKVARQDNAYFPLARDQQGSQKQRRFLPKRWRFVLIGGDGLLLLVLFTIFLILIPHLAIGVSVYKLGTWDAKLIWGCLALFSWSFVAKISQAQDPANAIGRFTSVMHVLIALVLMSILWMVLTYPFILGDAIFYFKLPLCFLAIAAPTFSLWRVILADVMILPRFRLRAVIIGANAAGMAVAKELSCAKRPRASILGYIHEGADERPREDSLPILGNRNMLRHLAQEGTIDMIITAVDYLTHPGLFQEAIEAMQMGIPVVPMPVAYENACGKLPVQFIGDQWYAVLPSQNIVSPMYLFWHKLMDIICSICGMVVLLLILPILAPLIYLDSPGPIFYHQERLGYWGRKFYIHKFRSMHSNAERVGQAVWAQEHDPRVTRVGRLMRATHLDELPQVFNILRGEMSLIGPRPERHEFIKDLEKTIPFYRCRLMVKPGLTGWAQVRFRYAGTDQEALIKSQYDLFYIRHQSFVLDISIILQTVTEVLFRRGV